MTWPECLLSDRQPDGRNFANATTRTTAWTRACVDASEADASWYETGCWSFNVCGLSEKKGATRLRVGYEILRVESHGDSGKEQPRRDRLFVGGDRIRFSPGASVH